MISFEVYITFVFVVVFASLVVISKIVIYDLWIKQKVVQQDEKFIPLTQETFSNIRYTGMGYIPKDFIKFHSQWKNNNDE